MQSPLDKHHKKSSLDLSLQTPRKFFIQNFEMSVHLALFIYFQKSAKYIRIEIELIK